MARITKSSGSWSNKDIQCIKAHGALGRSVFPRTEVLGGKEFVYTSSSLVVTHKQKPPTTPSSTPLPREIRNSSFLLLHSGPNSKMHRTYSMRQSRAPTASQIQNPPPPISSTKTGRFFGKTNIGELLGLFNCKGAWSIKVGLRPTDPSSSRALTPRSEFATE